tara:strand:- start:200 stop:511 length:312 start_codon:yes stop_codon:yes gene_type:complete
MNYVTGDFDICGTSLQGTINTSYDRLVELFGQPLQLEEGDGKVQVEWAVKFNDGTLATIYDWKEDKTASAVTEWHIGGFSQAAVFNVIDEVISSVAASIDEVI